MSAIVVVNKGFAWEDLIFIGPFKTYEEANEYIESAHDLDTDCGEVTDVGYEPHLYTDDVDRAIVCYLNDPPKSFLDKEVRDV